MNLLKNNATALGITLGNTLLPHISELAEKLMDAANKVQAFAEKHPNLTRNLLIEQQP
ncbi:phage tail tape measure protein [Anaerobacillus sp. HL2]|nr:phage tail tape measure protein [Anaerobacillus sp. HL2]